MHTSNPALSMALNQAGSLNFGGLANPATISGTVTKSILLVLLAFISAYGSMYWCLDRILAQQTVPALFIWGSTGVAFVLALFTCFFPAAAPFTAPLYAVAEGVALGAISIFMELKFPGIVITAVTATFATVITMLVLWKFRIVRMTAKFQSFIIGATLAVAVLYLLNFVAHLFGYGLLPDKGPLAIIVSLGICIIAALNLLLNFSDIEESVKEGLPKHYEFFNAFGLLLTIIWLYLEILRLIAIIRGSSE